MDLRFSLFAYLSSRQHKKPLGNFVLNATFKIILSFDQNESPLISVY